MAKYTYSSAEKLKSRKTLEQLFAKGKSLSAFPVKLLYTEVKETDRPALQGGVGVSARNFKKAVDRNRIKRLLRESYRLNKLPLQQLLMEKEKQYALFLLYVGKELPEQGLLHSKTQELLQQLAEKIG
jgi:ribonuclease P protein component